MSYSEALEAAGAEIITMEHFGSYQGDWWALVEYEGERGFVTGSFGSCSGCDAFEAEFGWNEGRCEAHAWVESKRCKKCDAAKVEYKERLARFGRDYLESLMTTEEAIEQASKYIEWDAEAPEMVRWIKKAAQDAAIQ